MRTVLLLAAVAALSGCNSPLIWRIPPTGAAPGLLYSDVAYPNEPPRDVEKDIPYEPDRIEIVGWVEKGRGSASFAGRFPGIGSGNILGIKNSDYASTYTAILRENDLDGLLNITVDTRRWDLNLFLARFYSTRTVVGGVGYRFRDPSAPPRIVQPVLGAG